MIDIDILIIIFMAIGAVGIVASFFYLIIWLIGKKITKPEPPKKEIALKIFNSVYFIWSGISIYYIISNSSQLIELTIQLALLITVVIYAIMIAWYFYSKKKDTLNTVFFVINGVMAVALTFILSFSMEIIGFIFKILG